MKKRRGFPPSALPLLGSNQDSPDPEGSLKPAEFQQPATLYASSCHPMLEFAGSDARLCRTLLTQMSDFAESISAFQSYPLDHWRRPIVLSRSCFFGL